MLEKVLEKKKSYEILLVCAAFANSTHVQKNKNIEQGKKLIEHYLVLLPFTGNTIIKLPIEILMILGMYYQYTFCQKMKG